MLKNLVVQGSGIQELGSWGSGFEVARCVPDSSRPHRFQM